MESRSNPPRGSKFTLNPNATNFGPTPSARPQSSHHTTTIPNEIPLPPISPVFAPSTVQGLTSEQAEAFRLTFPSVEFPHLQSSQMRQPVPPVPSTKYQKWVTGRKERARNHLPLVPFPMPAVMPIRTEMGRVPAKDRFHSELIAGATVDDLPFRSEATVQEVENANLLFPPETRAHGLDGNLIRQALSRTLTAEDVANHFTMNMNVDGGHHGFPLKSSPCSSNDSDLTVVPRQNQAGYKPSMLQSQPSSGKHKGRDNQMASEPPGLTMRFPPNVPFGAMGARTPHRVPYRRARKADFFSNQTRVLPHGSPQGADQNPFHLYRGPPTNPYFLRKKRIDQGPLPSEADIYPEDAVDVPDLASDGNVYMQNAWVPQVKQPTRKESVSQQVEDFIKWPTPAESYSFGMRLGVPAAPPGQSSVESKTYLLGGHAAEEHGPNEAYRPTMEYRPTEVYMPTNVNKPAKKNKPVEEQKPAEEQKPVEGQKSAEEKKLADRWWCGYEPYYPPKVTEEECPLYEPDLLPKPEPQPQVHSEPKLQVKSLMESSLSPVSLVNRSHLMLVPCDPRPLSPGQLDGTRYGLASHGFGRGEDWNPSPVVPRSEFRIRPRNHDGWGGHRWASENGWAADN